MGTAHPTELRFLNIQSRREALDVKSGQALTLLSIQHGITNIQFYVLFSGIVIGSVDSRLRGNDKLVATMTL